jgi:ketopantoate reductase
VVRLGREAGIRTPVHDALYGILLPQERSVTRRGAGDPLGRS